MPAGCSCAVTRRMDKLPGNWKRARNGGNCSRMSVRKSLSRTPSSSALALRSLGIWALLAIASFIVGLFILSPLINVAAGSHSASPAVNSSASPAPSAPPPSTLAVVPNVTERKRAERPADADVQITTDKPKTQDHSEIQNPQGLDNAGAAPSTGEQSNRDKNASRRTRNEEGKGDPQNTSAVDRTDRNVGDSAAGVPEEPKPRPRRSRRSRTETPSVPSGDKSTPDGDVQKGEGIDR